MQMWTMVLYGRKYGPYPFWISMLVMRLVLSAAKAMQRQRRQRHADA